MPAHITQTSFLLCFCQGLDCGCTFCVASVQTPNRGPRRMNKQAIQTPCFACYLSIMLVNKIYLPAHIVQTSFLLCFCPGLDCGCTFRVVSLQTPNRGPRRVNKQAIQTPCFACYLSIMLVNQIYLPAHIVQTLFLLCFCQSLDCGCTLC